MKNSKTMTELANIKQQLAATYRNHLNPIYNSISLKQVDMVDEHVKVLIFGDNWVSQCVANKLMNLHNDRTYNNGLFTFFVPSERQLTLNYGTGAQFFPAFAAKIRHFVRPALVEVSTYSASGIIANIGSHHCDSTASGGSNSKDSDSDQNQFYSQISCILEAPVVEDEGKSPFLYILAPQIMDFTPHDVLDLLFHFINVVDRILVVLPMQNEIPQHIKDFLYVCQQREIQEKLIICQAQQKLQPKDVRTMLFEIQIISQQVFQFTNKIMKIHPIVLQNAKNDFSKSRTFIDDFRDIDERDTIKIDAFQNVIDLLGQTAESLIQQDIQYFLNDAQVVQKELQEFIKNTQTVTYHVRETINIALCIIWALFLIGFWIYINNFENDWINYYLKQYNIPNETLIAISLGLTAINIVAQLIKIKRRPRMSKYEQLNDNFKKNVMIKAETLEEILYAGKSYLSD